MSELICYEGAHIESIAKTLPIGFAKDIEAIKHQDFLGALYCFDAQEFSSVMGKYRGYAVSEVALEEAQRIREGEIISGCCDRADQY